MRIRGLAFALVALVLLVLVVLLACLAAAVCARGAGSQPTWLGRNPPIAEQRRARGGADESGAAGLLAPSEHPAGAVERLDWPAAPACFPPALLAEALRAVRAVPGFGPLTSADRATLGAAATKLSARHGVAVRPATLAALRQMEIALAVQRAGARALSLGEQLVAAHRGGDSVLALAARFRLPPLSVLRQLLLEAGRSAKEVRAMLAHPETLPPRLAAEAPAILAADLGSRPNCDRIRQESQAFEDRLGAWLAAKGVRAQSEADLRAAGSTLTPDFKLAGPVAIGGHEVWWIDAKNYAETGSRLVAKSLASQAEKYVRAFGPGAFVFAGGLVCQSSPPPGVLYLDGTFLAEGPPSE